MQIAAAAEIYAQQEGIVNVYSDETSGREFVDQARAALTAEDIARATEIGRRLTIKEALDLARIQRRLRPYSPDAGETISGPVGASCSASATASSNGSSSPRVRAASASGPSAVRASPR